MSLLKDLVMYNESDDLSRLPKDVLTAIKSNIRKGAEDLKQRWGNALELVHKAYEIEGAQRPSPDMDAAWKQYEENLQYAVQQLAKNRGMEDDWRMSAAVFHEARTIQQFQVALNEEQFITEGKDVDQVIRKLTEKVDYDVQADTEGNQTRLSLSKWGIQNPIQITITQL